ncbi:sigma-70 family RNA polymerase sigma factor [Cellulomonas sp. JH27-2]|uniref:RNA polymerase sigma factor n=1 Tax=Cellulomonas sp. JH27-2 TaxID=2774139 RepID=UPI00177B37D8|nr:sigma-70 family RNA polymerase sigma factor [Cellulomonas sp. JH27-2]MBD8058030.1 sigma-70 family RNA polymerase sigma factor [Cellulomonas sp. JH27-2]
MTDVDAALALAWRTSWSRLVGLLIGQYQRPDLAEDAVGDAFESAARHWPSSGVPTNPGAWLLTAARRRVLDRLRTEAVHRRKEPLMVVDDEMRAAAAAADSLDDGAHVADEQLRLIFSCAHPALAVDDRVALTLRFVVGLTTAEIARLMLVQDTAMAARLTRAKKRLASSGIPFAVPPAEQLDSRLDVVAPVLYLMFTSAYQPGAGPVTLRVDLGDEAIRLVRQLDLLLPARAVLRPLLALMLLQHSRRDARLTPDGELILLPDQDRTLWHAQEIAEALTLLSPPPSPGRPAAEPSSASALSARLAGSSPGRASQPAVRRETRDPSDGTGDPAVSALAQEYRLQALIAAEHATAATAAATDWTAICRLYEELEAVTGSPVVRLARAVATAEDAGPQAGLDLLVGLDDALPRHHRLPAVRAELLTRAGDPAAAAAEYHRALALVTNDAERTHLTTRLASLTP